MGHRTDVRAKAAIQGGDQSEDGILLVEVRGVEEQGDLGLTALGEGVRIAIENDRGARVCTGSMRPSTRLRKNREVFLRSVVTSIYILNTVRGWFS